MASISRLIRFVIIFALLGALVSLISASPTYGNAPSRKYLYASPKCRRPLIRKDWRALSTSEKKAYIAAVRCLGNKKKAKSITGIPGLQNRYDDFQAGHFMLWHRYYIAIYEKTLRDVCGYRGAQPYWNWTIDNNSGKDMSRWPIFDNHTGFGGNGVYVDGENPFAVPERSDGGCVPKGPFAWPKWSVNLGPGSSLAYNPRCLTRDFSRPMVKWATPALANWELDVNKYSDFAYRLENVLDFTVPNVHGAGHFGVGGALGALGDVYASPGDPIFYLHHTTMNRMLWTWQKRNLPARLFDVGGPIIPFDYTGPNITLGFKVGLGKLAPNVTLAQIMNSQGDILCYDYE